MQKTWFITGASRGLGALIARAAIQAGDRVIATGRKREDIVKSLGQDNDQLLGIALDVTDAAQANAAVQAAVSRFGGIDVLVNNAGYGHLGFFEENTIEDVQAQFATNLFGVFNVTWAGVMPAMRSSLRP
jgi:NAD(P)-dependent dehydrogenase (short-subunit alcohol dehydrogenase family)